MTHLPVLRGSEIIKALSKIGYSETRQKGLECPGKISLTIPNHMVGRGLLRKILCDAGLSQEDFKKLLE